MKPGRKPLELTEKLAARICRRLSEGLSLTTVCRLKDMPSESTVRKWTAENATFATAYARAREAGIGVHAERLIDLADSATPQTANAVRLQVDVRRWLLSKLLPAVYGDKVDMTTAGRPIVPDHIDMLELAKRRYFLGLVEAQRQLPAPAELAPIDVTPTLEQPAATPEPIDYAERADHYSRERQSQDHASRDEMGLASRQDLPRVVVFRKPLSGPRG